MAGLLDDIEVELVCRGCGRKTAKTVGWIRSHEQFVCSCGVANEAIWFQEAIAQASREWSDLIDTLNLFGPPARLGDASDERNAT
jgi:hypothetical protein